MISNMLLIGSWFESLFNYRPNQYPSFILQLVVMILFKIIGGCKVVGLIIGFELEVDGLHLVAFNV